MEDILLKLQSQDDEISLSLTVINFVLCIFFSLKIVRDNKSKIYLNDNNLNTEINNDFRYFYENKIFN